MIKKRTLIAIIITITTIIVTNKFWLVFRPMPVDFDIHGKGKCNVEVQLNKKDNDEFNKIKSQSITLDLDRDSHASFNVKRARHPKRIRLVITGLENDTPIEISNFTLRNGKYNLDELNLFSISTGKFIIKNNSIIVYPNNNSFNLEYKKTLSVRTAVKFDFKLFVIILVLTYLLTYKLSNYVADFKSVKEKSRIEIIFLTIFFTFLFVPMSNINQDEISVQENRTLAKWQSFITEDGEINYDFGKNFNEWFNDRLYKRNKIISIYLKIKYSLASDYAEVPLGYMYKKSGWMFYEQSQRDINNSFEPLSNNELKQYTGNIRKLLDYCNKSNIKLYIIISPTKEYLYRNEDYVNTAQVVEKTKKLVENVAQELNYEIIYPEKELKELKNKEYVCYKTDHHLTDSASYLIYKLLLEQMKKDFSDLKITKKNDFNITYNNLIRWDCNREYQEGYNYKRANLHDKKLLKTKYKYYDYKELKNIAISGEFPHYSHINPNGKYKMFIIGNSFCENLTYFLDTSFKEIQKYRFNSSLDFPKRKAPLDISGYLPLIEEQKPDVLLLVLSSGYIDNLKDLYDNEGK